MLVTCFTCGKEFEVPEHKDPVMAEMFKNVRRFCSTKCANEALTEHVRKGDAIDAFMALSTETAKRIM